MRGGRGRGGVRKWGRGRRGEEGREKGGRGMERRREKGKRRGEEGNEQRKRGVGRGGEVGKAIKITISNRYSFMVPLSMCGEAKTSHKLYRRKERVTDWQTKVPEPVCLVESSFWMTNLVTELVTKSK